MDHINQIIQASLEGDNLSVILLEEIDDTNLHQNIVRRSRSMKLVTELAKVPIKKSDIPCRQCCDSRETNRTGKYVANSCKTKEEMYKCPIWHYREDGH